jgi:transketolase
VSAPAPSMFSPAALERARELNFTLGRPNLDVFAETVLAEARRDPRLLVVTSDSRGSARLAGFAGALPAQLIEVGIAEQNLVGIAAGLADSGRRVFAVSPACFLAARALEQIKNDVAYSNNPVKLVGISAGVSYGALGSTHHSLHDLAALRAINNVDIIVPADNTETRWAVKVALSSEKPVYLRFGKAPLFNLHSNENACESGKAIKLRAGSDLSFIATGETVAHALLAAADLAATDSVSCEVWSVPSIRPLDIEAIRSAAACNALISVEEHMVNGGLGEACAAILLESGCRTRFRRVGIPDEYTVTGSQADIFRHYGISMEGLATQARELLAGDFPRS